MMETEETIKVRKQTVTWDEEALECGEVDLEEVEIEEFEISAEDLSRELREYTEASERPLTGNLERVWVSVSEECFRTGEVTESSLHLAPGQSFREALIWTEALRNRFTK